MSIYNYEEAFGAWDKTTIAMRRAIEDWFNMYYQQKESEKRDPCQRIPYLLVNKIVRTMFGEYRVEAAEPFIGTVAENLNRRRKEAMQLALVGGECYLKPCFEGEDVFFTLIPRNNVLVFARDVHGEPTDLGTVEQVTLGNDYYTLLERRTVDTQGYLTIRNRLYRSRTAQSLGMQVPLSAHPAYQDLVEEYCYEKPVGSVGLVRLKTPMVNCVDGSADGVSLYAAAVGLIENLNRNEAQMNGEFQRGESRIIASADLLNREGLGLTDHLFVGLDEDPEQVGLTVFSPALREQSFLARKQEYLRNIESLIGLRRGMLADVDTEQRTATEITSTAGDYNLTVIDFQEMWESGLRQVIALCCKLGALYGINVPKEVVMHIDWGNGVLYDEDKTWEDYKAMVAAGLLKPEIALGWRFNMPTDSEEALMAVRKRYLPQM